MGNEKAEKMIEKIRKVMELAERGSTEAERDTAMLQAQKLLDKYNLSMSDIKTEDKKYVNGDDLHVSSKSSIIETSVSSIIKNYYNVQIIVFNHVDEFGYKNRKLRIFGQKHNVEIARYMFPWLMSEFDQRWNDYKRENGLKTKYKNTFILGLYQGLSSKHERQREDLAKEYSGSADLAVLDETAEIMNWIKSQMDISSKKSPKINVKDYGVMDDGIKEGGNISLNTQVE